MYFWYCGQVFSREYRRFFWYGKNLVDIVRERGNCLLYGWLGMVLFS